MRILLGLGLACLVVPAIAISAEEPDPVTWESTEPVIQVFMVGADSSVFRSSSDSSGRDCTELGLTAPQIRSAIASNLTFRGYPVQTRSGTHAVMVQVGCTPLSDRATDMVIMIGTAVTLLTPVTSKTYAPVGLQYFVRQLIRPGKRGSQLAKQLADSALSGFHAPVNQPFEPCENDDCSSLTIP